MKFGGKRRGELHNPEGIELKAIHVDYKFNPFRDCVPCLCLAPRISFGVIHVQSLSGLCTAFGYSRSIPFGIVRVLK